MPITQDRMIALIDAGEHYRQLVFALRNDLTAYYNAQANGQAKPEDFISLIYERLIVWGPEANYVQTMVTERIHFKHNKHRNERTKREMEAKRRAQGITAVDKPQDNFIWGAAKAGDMARAQGRPFPNTDPNHTIPEHPNVARAAQILPKDLSRLSSPNAGKAGYSMDGHKLPPQTISQADAIAMSEDGEITDDDIFGAKS